MLLSELKEKAENGKKIIELYQQTGDYQKNEETIARLLQHLLTTEDDSNTRVSLSVTISRYNDGNYIPVTNELIYITRGEAYEFLNKKLETITDDYKEFLVANELEEDEVTTVDEETTIVDEVVVDDSEATVDDEETVDDNKESV